MRANGDLHQVRIVDVFTGHERTRNGGHWNMRASIVQRFNGEIDQRWFDARFVALHIHNDVRVHVARNLRNATCSVDMIGACELRMKAGLGDRVENALVIRGHNHALNVFGLGGLRADMDNDGRAREQSHWLARKSHAAPTRGNDRDRF